MPWVAKAQLPDRIEGFAAAAVDRSIYIAGGAIWSHDNSGSSGFTITRTNKAWRYDHDTNLWTPIADLPVIRGDLAGGGAALGGKFYVAGGSVSGSARFDVYDPATDTWTQLANMPGVRKTGALVAHGGFLYYFGGNNTSGQSPNTNTWRYDPATDTWAVLAPIPVAHSSMGAGVQGDRIRLIGHTVSGTQTSHYAYDPATDTWAGPLTGYTPVVFDPACVGVPQTDRLHCWAGGQSGSGGSAYQVEAHRRWNGTTWTNDENYGLGLRNVSGVLCAGHLYGVGGHSTTSTSTTLSRAVRALDLMLALPVLGHLMFA